MVMAVVVGMGGGGGDDNNYTGTERLDLISLKHLVKSGRLSILIKYPAHQNSRGGAWLLTFTRSYKRKKKRRQQFVLLLDFFPSLVGLVVQRFQQVTKASLFTVDDCDRCWSDSGQGAGFGCANKPPHFDLPNSFNIFIWFFAAKHIISVFLTVSDILIMRVKMLY